MIDPAARPSGPAGVLRSPSPMEFWGQERVRLERAIKEALAFSSRVNAGIAENSNPNRFLVQEQSRLGRAIQQARRFAEEVNSHAGGTRPGPKDLMKGGKIDMIG